MRLGACAMSMHYNMQYCNFNSSSVLLSDMKLACACMQVMCKVLGNVDLAAWAYDQLITSLQGKNLQTRCANVQ